MVWRCATPRAPRFLEQIEDIPVTRSGVGKRLRSIGVIILLIPALGAELPGPLVPQCC